MVGLARHGRRRHHAATAALALALLLGGSRPAAADGDPNLAAARSAIESLDYATARTALASALASGSLGPDELREIYLLTGTVTGSLGDAAAATQAFRKLLALSPTATLDAGTTPKVAKPFAAASKVAKGRPPLHVSTTMTVSPPSVTLVVDSDPERMVTGARVTVTADRRPAQTLDAKGSGRIVVALPAARRLELRVAAIDQHGNRLVELGTSDAIVIEAATVTTPVPPRPGSPAPIRTERPLYAKWWLWGAVSLAAAGTGTAFGLATRSAGKDLDALNATSLDHDFGEAQAVLDRGRRDALITNIAFGVAGASAIAAVMLLVIAPSSTPRERAITVAPTPTRGGTAITVEVTF